MLDHQGLKALGIAPRPQLEQPKVLRQKPEIMEKCSEAFRETFRNRVENALGETEDEQAKQYLETIAKAIGLELESTPEPEKLELEAPDREEGDDAE